MKLSSVDVKTYVDHRKRGTVPRGYSLQELQELSELTSVPLEGKFRQVCTTLYRFYDAKGELLYVGISSSTLFRMGQHHSDKAWWDKVATARFEHFKTRAEALKAESKAIREEEPTFNVAGKLVQKATDSDSLLISLPALKESINKQKQRA